MLHTRPFTSALLSLCAFAIVAAAVVLAQSAGIVGEGDAAAASSGSTTKPRAWVEARVTKLENATAYRERQVVQLYRKAKRSGARPKLSRAMRTRAYQVIRLNRAVVRLNEVVLQGDHTSDQLLVERLIELDRDVRDLDNTSARAIRRLRVKKRGWYLDKTIMLRNRLARHSRQLNTLGTSEGSRVKVERAEGDLVFRTINADKELRGEGKGAMRNRTVIVKDATTGTEVARGRTGAGGLLVLGGIDDSLTITVTATAPKGYVTFPVEKRVADIGPDDVVDIPLYKKSQQWLSWGKTTDRRRVGAAAGRPKGAPLWKWNPQNNMEFPPSVAYGVVVYGSYHGFLCANDQKTGELLWQEYIGAPYDKISKFANQVAVDTWKKDGEWHAFVYYADLRGIVGCRDLFTGEKIWEIRRAKGKGTGGKSIWFRSVESSPLIVGGSVFFCTRYDKRKSSRAGLWALDKRTGKVRFFRRLARNSKTKIGASPVYRSGRVFVATYDGYVYAVSRWTGKVRWRRRLGGQFYSTPAVYGSRLFVGNKSNGRMYCLKTTNGRVLWRTKRLGKSVHGSPAVSGGKVFVGAGKRFYALRMSNGRVAWSRRTKNRVWGSASVLKGVVYYSCRGRTYARKARNGRAITLPRSIRYKGRYSPITATRHLIIFTGRQWFYAYRPAN